jgi:GPH family glycoside/pentoside/hexuronide:cation symporter
LTFAGTRERDEYQRQEPPRFFRSLRAAFTNRPFLISIGIFLLTWVSIDILQTTLLYFIKYVALREAQSDLIMASIFVTAALSLPLWNGVSRRLDKRLAYMAGIGFWALVQVLLILLGGGTPMVLLLLLCVLAGIGVGAAHILTWAIMPDAVEWDELKSGRRHEGMFYSLMTLMQKVAVSIAIPLALLLLDRTGYVPNAEVQPRSVLIALRVLVGPVPALFLCGAILLAAFYPIDRLKFADIRRRIGERKRGPGAPDG